MTDEIAEVDSPQNETADLAEASTEDIRAALGITSEPSGKVAEATTTEAVQSEADRPAEQTVAGESQEEIVENEEERLAKRRIRPRTAEDQQVIDLYRSEGFQGSFDEASKIIYGHQTATPPPEETAQAQTENIRAREDAYIASTRSEIHDLERQVDEAADNLETSEALTLQRSVMRKEMDLKEYTSNRDRADETRRQGEFETHRQKAVESRDRVYEAYPELSDANSVERKQFDNYVSNVQNNPDYASVFQSPKWPELMAREYASSNGLQEQPLQSPVQSPPQQAPVMGNQARVLTSGSAAQPANSQLTPEQVANSIPNLSRDDLWAALGQNDGRRHLA